MKILIIKTSSMGDVIHTLPALTDAARIVPGIKFDWVVEENFAEIPRWHPCVDQVIPVALRRWRKNLFSKKTRMEWKKCYQQLRANQYDLIIDAQGLLKSAWLLFFVKGKRSGLDWFSARESLAALFYQKKIKVGNVREMHAVTRIRNLFSGALNYPIVTSTPDYGIDRKKLAANAAEDPYVVFLHGTTWETKHWPESYWIELAELANQKGYPIKLLWGNDVEHERARRIAKSCNHADVLPRMKLAEVAGVLAGATGIVAVDTGLGHLAAALDVPTVSLYGPTDPLLTGAVGKSQIHLTAKFFCSPCLKEKCTYQKNTSLHPPCFATVNPIKVWESLEKQFNEL